MEQPTIIVSPLKAAIPAQGGHLDLLVRVQAPDLPTDKAVEHSPKRLALVVDRSGSMQGKPLREALRCVMHIASHLTPKDQLSLVVYDDHAEVMVPLSEVSSVSAIQHAVDMVHSGGSTDLFSGWLRGAEQLEGGTARAVSRVLLLSDGQANHGETRISHIQQECKAWLEKGVSTTTVGLGRGFNEDLMIAMADAGGGQQYYGQTAEDLYDSFDQELSLLQAMYLRGIALKLNPAPGVIVEMLSVAPQHPDGTYKMNDLAWGAETWVGVRLHISPTAPGTLRDLLAVSITGTDLQGYALSLSSAMLQLPAVEQTAFLALLADELVERRLLEAEFGKASDELRHLARRGNRLDTMRKLTEMNERFGHHPWLRAKMEQMRQLAQEDMMMMAKEAGYASVRMYSRLSPNFESSFIKDETESDMPAFLRKKESEGRGRRTPKQN
ncbi:MAG: VWA domain-containing protein [Betaproteobacteria bacterium]|nr:VWA domain-containing protein [Betaproteobacteria bacterium]